MWNGINFYYYKLNFNCWKQKRKVSFLKLKPFFFKLFLLNPCRKLLVYPKGIYNGEIKAISLYLFCCDCVLPEQKFFAEFKIRIKDQINMENHVEKTGMYAYMCVCTHTCLLFSFTLFCSCVIFVLIFFLSCFVSYRKTLVHYLFKWMGFPTLYAS